MNPVIETPVQAQAATEAGQAASAFEALVQARRSVRVFDPTAPYDPQAVQRALRLATLAPNSSNLQLWEFYRVRTPELKQRLAEACMSQKAATTAAELIVIVANRSAWRAHANWMLDILKTPVANARPKPPAAADPTAYYSKLIPFLYTHDRLGILGGFKQAVAWFMGLSRPMYRQMSRSDIRITVHKSAALAAQTLMLALQSEGLNTCPMEGFDSVRVKRLLGLGGNREINMILGVGIGKPEGVYGPRLRVPESEVIFER